MTLHVAATAELGAARGGILASRFQCLQGLENRQLGNFHPPDLLGALPRLGCAATPTHKSPQIGLGSWSLPSGGRQCGVRTITTAVQGLTVAEIAPEHRPSLGPGYTSGFNSVLTGF